MTYQIEGRLTQKAEEFAPNPEAKEKCLEKLNQARWKIEEMMVSAAKQYDPEKVGFVFRMNSKDVVPCMT